MSNEIIGHNPNTIVLPEMPKPRNTESNAETGMKFVSLNSTDQRLSTMSDEEFDKIAQGMAARGISANRLKSSL